MNLVAAGDGNRVWFPEMIETLRSRWNTAMPFPVLIELCNILDGMFQRRRPRGPFLPQGSRCPACGRIVGSERQQRQGITVRATILSLRRFGIASPEVTKRTEKEWPDTAAIQIESVLGPVSLQLRNASAKTRYVHTQRQRNKMPFGDRTAHMRLDAVNFRSANFRSLNDISGSPTTRQVGYVKSRRPGPFVSALTALG